MFWCIAPSYVRFRAVVRCFLATSEVASYRERFYFDVFWHFSFYLFAPATDTLYKHTIAVKATIDKQSPHGKLLLKSGFFFETGSAC